ncbi:hypothetical protein BCT06_12900 [Vibrio breoganii]|uniref:hypothetical protein n=1 Tax=Vibrio breoganii TaxID=553239 RepID=UPI000C854E6D|nr:hypothetical protein [Vibrio breoganii]PML18404.1 hypothetical protein BCT84_20055 [Vibrio breoganii]PMO29656.1 hypothetical protein BCT12_07390 [Vibrio breoganii]PMO60312.1 hypothetical protein BCT06_12900 [Vibrio breoganii]
MRSIFLIFSLMWGINVFAKNINYTEDSLQELVPEGYLVTETIYGDLNKDNQEDVVLIIKGTNPDEIFIDQVRGELNLNRRGIVVALRNEHKYEVIVENSNCFYSEDEYGGVYAVPDIYTTIEKGNLYILFAHGRYGHWRYNFRYQSADFELIGYDESANRGSIVEVATSINYLTKKMLVKENTNNLDEYADPVFKETWTSFTLDNRIKLSGISDFSEFNHGLHE